jgi:hypothetical protein
MPISPQITVTPNTISTKSFAISAITYTSSTATYTATGHTFSVGDVVLITSISPDGYNGNFTITAIATNTFTVANTTNAAVTVAIGDAFWASATDYDLAAYSATYIADSTDLATVQLTADGKNKIYSQTSAPTASAIGDYWIDTDDYNKPYRWDGSTWQPVQDGTIAIAQTAANNAQSTANTAISNAATAYATGVAAQSTANTALSNAATAYTAAIGSLQPSASTIVNASNQMTAIASNGITVYSGASATTGARVVLNSAGIAGFDSSSTGPSTGATFSINSSTGAAFFQGNVTGSTITASTMNIGGNAIIDASGYLTATGATITGTITSSSATITGGSFTVGSAFQISTSGFLTATGAQIGPWYFGSGYISSISGGGGNYWSASTGALSTTNLYVTGTSGTTISMSGGNILTGGGNVTAGAGTISASTGTISGATVTSTGALNVSGTSTFGSAINANNYIYNAGYPSTTGAANMRINTVSGLIAYTSSSARYKVAIQEQSIPATSIYSLLPKSYVDKNEADQLGSIDGLQRWVGLIAEDIAEIPVLKNLLVEYNAEGEPNSVYYDRVGVALIPAIKDLNNRLLALEGK